MNVMRKLGEETDGPGTARPSGPGLRLVVMFSLPALLLAGGIVWWMLSGRTVATDNAQVSAHIVNVAPEVSGRIVEVHIRENQQVKAGALLYRIDPEPYRIALMQAQAAFATAQMEVGQLQGAYSSRRADIGSKSSDAQLAKENFERQQELLARGFTTRARYDEARAALAAAQAERTVAEADAQSARAMIGTDAAGRHPQVEAARAQVAKAELDLKRTEIRAPIDGRIAQSDRLVPGAMAVQMMPGVAIVGADEPWIEANFKETQLAKIRPGQRARIEIDAIPGKTYRGHVVGIGSGTGSKFSILPAQNATGNWVKVTQRVPVRLVFDEKPDQPIVSGWSAHVTVRVQD